MDISFGNYIYLLLLLVLPVVGFLLVSFIRWRRTRKDIFAEHAFQKNLFSATGIFSYLMPYLYIVAFLFLIFSIIDLLAGREQVKTQQKMSNVIFLLDVSNSMNAEDIQPSRLDEAKNIMVNVLPKLANDRVGVVVFAGQASSIMPLTTDFTAAENYINGIETSVLQVQGTDFLKAMQAAVKKFKGIPKGARQVVLLSDGEDNEGNEKPAIRLAKDEGISMTTVGIGTEQGAPVPEYFYGQLMGYKMDINGETVSSKRETGALKDMAESTGGTYIDGNNMQQAIQHIAEAIRENKGSTSVTVDSQNAVHYYQYFLAVAVLLFFIIYLFNPKNDLNL